MLLLDRQAPPPQPAAAVQTVDERRRTRLVLAAALVVCLGLRVPYMNLSLGIDEGGVAFIAKAWGTGGHGSLYGAYWLDRPPLLVALYKLAVPGGAVGIRVLGALAALALVITTTLVTRAVAGHHAARVAAVLSAGLASSIALAAVFTPAELLAAVPACASIGCLVAAHRSGQARWLVGAGLLAVTAALIKQSFLDAGFAGAIFLIAASVRDRRPRLRWAGAYAIGALIPFLPVAAWLLVAHVSPGSLGYALIGFRVHALHALSASSVPLHIRIRSLIGPGVLSGLFVVLLIGTRGIWMLRRDGVLVVTLVAWLAAGAVGVLAGGSYWSHYLIQLVAPATLLAGVALAGLRPRLRAPAVIALAAVAIIGTAGAVAPQRAIRQRSGVVDVGRYVRTHARPGDTQYVMYAKANAGYYTGLQSPYPYAWSLLIRAVPGAMPRLLHLLQSPRRPTWIVGWQPPSSWQLDPGHAIAHALNAHYRVVAHVDGHPIYHRISSSPAPPSPRRNSL
jgi:4-amino-4-deoxy-L-arabinose transferase-like glycosyltransferase